MDLHALSRACHHPDGLVCFLKGSDDMSRYIVSISKPSNKEPRTEVTEGLVIDAELLDRVLKVPITTVKSLVKSVLDGFVLGSFVHVGGDFLKERATGNTNIKQCLRKANNPYKLPSSMPSVTFSKPSHVAEADSVFGCIKSFPKGGVEAVLHSVNRLLSEYHNDGSLSMLIVYFSNAFNLVDRTALLYEVKLFRGAVSRDTYSISGLAMRRATNAVDLMSLLPQLHDL
nr:reverse transcriptase domain-containing protein [Tanacetum cinerariifolium]